MKKVIFEQTGNIISVLLLIASSIEFISTFKVDNYNFEIYFGIFTFALIAWIPCFIIARLIYSKFDKNYNIKKGEYSETDEREVIIYYKSSLGAYKAIVFSLLIFFVAITLLAAFSNSMSFNNIHLGIISMLFFGFSIIVGLLTYLLIWIFLYLK